MERTIELDLRMLKHRQYVDDVNQFGWLKDRIGYGCRLPVIPALQKVRAMIERCTAVRRSPNCPSDFEAAVLKRGTASPERHPLSTSHMPLQ